jgi:hypothetical protein
VNVSDRDWPLVLGWLVAALRPSGPFAVLFLYGEQGSAKTTLAMLLRSLCDPNTASTRASPRDERDLAIAANNSWIISLNNLSFLPDWLSDALCRLNSGEGFATRTLYENEDETIFNVTRAIVMNGIAEIVIRPDLLDRTISVCCPTIDETKRRDEQGFWREFENVRPGIIGALFDAVATGLRSLPNLKLDRLPRLADFTRWAVACEPSLGLKNGAFLKAYRKNIKHANELALEASSITGPLLEFLEANSSEWSGTASELLDKLTNRASEQKSRLRDWPKSAHALSTKLRRVGPNFRKIGIEVDFKHDGKQRIITLCRIETQKCVSPVSCVRDTEKDAESAISPALGDR